MIWVFGCFLVRSITRNLYFLLLFSIMLLVINKRRGKPCFILSFCPWKMPTKLILRGYFLAVFSGDTGFTFMQMQTEWLTSLHYLFSPIPIPLAQPGQRSWFSNNSWKLLLLSDKPILLFGKPIHCFITLFVHPRYREQV